MIAEAGVSASPISGRFSIPVLFVAGASNTGIAFANILDQAVDMTLILKDEDGAELARVERNLPAGEHLPKFASEFFDILAGMAEFSGSIEVQVSAGVAAIALKQQGVLLTTFPVVVLQ